MSVDQVGVATASVTTDLSACQISQFRSIVLERILFFAYPADAVVCLNTHWHIRSEARQQISKNVAAPKNGVLLLKYPLCFANREDLRCVGGPYRFLYLIKHNLHSKYTDEDRVITEFQTFLAGYEEMLLDEVCASLHLYINLATLMVDFGFSVRESLGFRHFVRQISEYSSTDIQLDFNRDFGKLLGTERDDDGPRTMFIAWERWSNTIAKVISRSAATLTNFVCVGPDDWADCSFHLYLPKQFLAALRFDKMLAKTQNLRTLYMPLLREYEEAMLTCYKPDGSSALNSRRLAWQALHALPEHERLPNLQRIVVQRLKDLLELPAKDEAINQTFVPNFPTGISVDASKSLTIVAQRDKSFMPGMRNVFDMNPVVSPAILILPEIKCINVVGIFVKDVESKLWGSMRHAGDYQTAFSNTTTHQTFSSHYSFFRVEIDAFGDYIQKLSLVGDAVPHCYKRNNKLHASFHCYGLGSEPTPNLDVETARAMCAAICRIPSTAQKCSLPVQLNLTIKCAEKEVLYYEPINKLNSEFARMVLLPLFADGSRYVVSSHMLHACRVVFQSSHLSNFSDIVRKLSLDDDRSEHEEAVGNEFAALQYKFPPITLNVVLKQISWQSNVDAEQWAQSLLYNFYRETPSDADASDVVQQQDLINAFIKFMRTCITEKFDAFLLDAVDAYRRRDLAYYFYQSLIRCRFVIPVMVMDRVPNDTDRKILRLLDTAWIAHAMQMESQLMAKIYESVDCATNEFALALPVLKSFQFHVRFYYFMSEDEQERQALQLMYMINGPLPVNEPRSLPS